MKCDVTADGASSLRIVDPGSFYEGLVIDAKPYNTGAKGLVFNYPNHPHFAGSKVGIMLDEAYGGQTAFGERQLIIPAITNSVNGTPRETIATREWVNSNGTPKNMVTTDTAQTITGSKKFSSNIRLISASIDSILDKVHIEHSDNDNYVDINSYGVINLTNDNGNIDGVLRLPHKGTTSSPKTIAVTSDIPDISNLVTTNTYQTITGQKVFTGTLQAYSLTDGTTTKTMTEVISGTTEEWTFTLSDGTTVTKNVKLGA